jgi:hypothetical protein
MLEWIAAVDAMEREIAAEAAELKKAEAAAQEKAPPLVVARRIAYAADSLLTIADRVVPAARSVRAVIDTNARHRQQEPGPSAVAAYADRPP